MIPHSTKAGRAESAWINGAKSKGPKPPKACSTLKQPAKHGLYAVRGFMLPGESVEEFAELQAQLRAYWRPMGFYDETNVEQLAGILRETFRLQAAKNDHIHDVRANIAQSAPNLKDDAKLNLMAENRASIDGNAGTATVDIWKIGTGAAKPAVANTITGSAKPAISTGAAAESTVLTGWTATGVKGDWFARGFRRALHSAGCRMPVKLALILLAALPVFAAYPNGYGYRRALTINPAQLTGGVSNFPVLVRDTYSYLRTVDNDGLVTDAQGDDVVFTAADGTTPLKHEIELYTAATGEVAYWVKLPSISSSVATVFYIYYGNASVTTDQSDKTNVWDSNYKGVYHFPNGATLTANDSTANANHGAPVNTPTATAGKVDGGGSFASASSQYVSLGTPGASLQFQTLTVSAWVNPTNGTERALTGGVGFSNGYPEFRIDSGGTLTLLAQGQAALGTSSGTVPNGSWSHVAVTYSTPTWKFYINGMLSGSGSYAQTFPYGSDAFALGYGYGGEYFNGSLDEQRLSGSVRDADWILAEYKTTNSPSTFYTVGSQETSGSGVTSVNDDGAGFIVVTGTSTDPVIGVDSAVAATKIGTTRLLGVAAGNPAGSALAAGVLGYTVAPAACTIVGWDIIVDSGTATVDVWKAATGTVKPMSTESITASAKPAITSGTAIASTALTGWTTGVSSGDMLGFNLETGATAKYIMVGVRCR